MAGGFTKALMAIGVIAAVAGCDPNAIATRQGDAPDVFWDGYLTELDGMATSDSGIRLEIRTNRTPGEPELIYNLETGCVGGGFLKNTGEVQAFETLRSCAVEDVPRMMRLNRLSYAGTRLPGEQAATLRWEGDEATLESAVGKARFAKPERMRTATE